MQVLEIGHPTINSNIPMEYLKNNSVCEMAVKLGLIALLVLGVYYLFNYPDENERQEIQY